MSCEGHRELAQGLHGPRLQAPRMWLTIWIFVYARRRCGNPHQAGMFVYGVDALIAQLRKSGARRTAIHAGGLCECFTRNGTKTDGAGWHRAAGRRCEHVRTYCSRLWSAD